MRKLSIPALLLGAAALAAGCEDAGNVLEVEATGEVRGVAFVDQNGNGALDNNQDRALAGTEIRLLVPGSGAVIAQAVADTAGVYRIEEVPVGRYVVAVDPAVLGDSVQVVAPRQEISVTPGAAQTVRVGVGYPRISIAEARALPAGTRVFVEGLVTAAYGDTAHVTLGSGSIRATRLRSTTNISGNAILGDSVRIQGVVGAHRGQPVLDDAVLFRLGALADTLPPRQLSTAAAAGASGGTLDAARVQVRGATVQQVRTVDGQSLVRVNDGSGPVDVWFGATPPASLGGFVGAVVNVTGVLVPASSGGGWWIRPAVFESAG